MQWALASELASQTSDEVGLWPRAEDVVELVSARSATAGEKPAHYFRRPAFIAIRKEAAAAIAARGRVELNLFNCRTAKEGQSMALFKKKPLMCPACDQEITEPQMTHWLRHAYVIEEGEGAGSYTWRCKCGLAPMYWAKDTQAASGMAIHMKDRHMIPIS